MTCSNAFNLTIPVNIYSTELTIPSSTRFTTSIAVARVRGTTKDRRSRRWRGQNRSRMASFSINYVNVARK